MIEHNDVRDNNLPNAASPETFQGKLPPGIGILASGVSGHTIAKNTVEGNDLVGIALLGWCTANQIPTPQDCAGNVTIGGVFYSPEVSNITVSHNKVSGNGGNPNPQVPFPSVDILYVQFPLFLEPGTGNCFEKNKPSGFTSFASTELDFSNYPDVTPIPGELPTDGCKKP